MKKAKLIMCSYYIEQKCQNKKNKIIYELIISYLLYIYLFLTNKLIWVPKKETYLK
jgi:hypothetical protein